MYTVIDSARPATAIAATLAREGIRTVMRCYNHRDVSIPGKRLTRAEAEALAAIGLSIGVVFQQRGGAGEPVGHIADLTAETGRRDAERALELAAEIGQPKGSAIYFAVDWDFIKQSELVSIDAYFEAIGRILGGSYSTGIYGSGLICDRLLTKSLVKLAWLAQSRGWSGHEAFLKSQRWALAQGPSSTWPQSSYTYDPNHTNPAYPDFGQFTPAGGAVVAAMPQSAPATLRSIMRVTARSGLLLRRGPGTSYSRVQSLPLGTEVFGISTDGDWALIDIQGDGAADGYAHRGYLELVAGGFPIDSPQAVSPYQIAQAELDEDIREYPGAATNPRIYLYHASTGHGEPDSVPWCASFVNFCVEKVGLIGTNSKAARSWHDQGWGDDVTSAPREGDIAVWQRRFTNPDGTPGSGGHVGFIVSFDSSTITVLGGNQSDRVSIASYPREGSLGGQSYRLLSIRRPRTMSIPSTADFQREAAE